MHPRIEEYYKSRGWKPFPFQEDVWARYARGESGLVHSATGTGKTLAAWGGPLADAIDHPGRVGLRALWITPLRALAADSALSMTEVARELGVDWRIETRTGDTPAAIRAKQRTSLPQAMITTPESASVLLANPEFPELIRDLDAVIVDEWHELLSSKRGTQTELVLARIRAYRPKVRVWGLSATLGNLDEALETLVGVGGKGVLVHGESGKEIVIDSLLPPRMDRFPWAGHFGGQMVKPICDQLQEGASTLIFCNTRAMAEIWYQNILALHPEWEGKIGLHHGSLDKSERDRVELGLKTGALKTVVATSSLDLGVDFHPVDRVFQIGSPKGVARLLQRAGRSGHRPGLPSRVIVVPTHALELVDITAARFAAERREIETRSPYRRPLDVLAQHLVTVACGPGFHEEELKGEVRRTAAYQSLSDAEWDWTMDFVRFGGASLKAYPEFQRVIEDEAGVVRATSDRIAKNHRLQIGTITSESAVLVRMVKGSVVGSVEENFAARLRPGDSFFFAGRALEFIRMKDMTVYVKKAGKTPKSTPRWGGGRMPLSGELARGIREELGHARDGELRSPEMKRLRPILELQARWSRIPEPDEILMELFEDGEGYHLFLYPMEGRLVHEGLSALLALRISRRHPITFTLACNDYGFELLSPEPIPWEDAYRDGLFSTDRLAEDVIDAMNTAELAKRQFREVARVAGLVNEGFPGRSKTAKQIQATSGLLYDVFVRYDSDNLLLGQAQREVLERQLEASRMRTALERINASKLIVTEPPRPTPMAFPILVDRLRETVTSEPLADRVARLTAELEIAADYE